MRRVPKAFRGSFLLSRPLFSVSETPPKKVCFSVPPFWIGSLVLREAGSPFLFSFLHSFFFSKQRYPTFDSDERC